MTTPFHPPVKRSVEIAGHKTSISLEPLFWELLKQAAVAEGLPINGQAGQYGQVNYAAAKSGIHGFTKALAQEGAKFGVTVNAIAPGYIDTDMVAAVPAPVLEKIVAKIPVGRLGMAEEIARGVAFLTSDNGGFVTGSTMSINGGQHMY